MGAIRSPGTLTGLPQLPARCLQAPDRTNYLLSDLSTPELVLNGESVERLILPQQDAKSLEQRPAKPILGRQGLPATRTWNSGGQQQRPRVDTVRRRYWRDQRIRDRNGMDTGLGVVIKCDAVANRDGECCITLETVSWREARLSSQSDSGIAPSPKTRALWNGQSRAVTGSHGGVARQRKDGLTDAASCCCALRQGIEREFLAQRVQVPSRPCTQPCTHVYDMFAPLDSGPRYGTARAVLSVVVQAGLQLPRCRLCFPTKQDADDCSSVRP